MREVHSEWVIPVGADVRAVGTVGQEEPGTNALVVLGADMMLVSTKPEPQMLGRNQYAVNDPRPPFGGPVKSSEFVIGLALLAVTVVSSLSS